MGWRQWLERGWQRRGARACLLLPVGLGFAALAALRRLLYRRGWLTSIRLPVPVVVVGNITAGGSGKTPLVLHLAQTLAARGWRPGIVSRGHGGRLRGIAAVKPDSDPRWVGDEPVLLARRAGCPVFVGRDRVAAARALLKAHPDCTILIADDGLQHLRLGRDVEIVVLDDRGLGNRWPLPAGPLRECPARIAEADALVINAEDAPPPTAARRLFRMRLVGERFHLLRDPARSCEAAALQGRRLRAVAGIGHPERFFRHLGRLGLQARCQAYPDHHPFRPADLALGDAEALLMTEKDAVKCSTFAPAQTWVLPVEARLEPDLTQWLMEKLDGRPPA